MGALGFLVDAILFVLANSFAGWPVHWSRTLSATSSITLTWSLNRRFTFRDRQSDDLMAEYSRYVISQLVGLTLNLGVFAGCLALVPMLRSYPLIALAIGAAAALLVNFITASIYAFRGNAKRENNPVINRNIRDRAC